MNKKKILALVLALAMVLALALAGCGGDVSNSAGMSANDNTDKLLTTEENFEREELAEAEEKVLDENGEEYHVEFLSGAVGAEHSAITDLAVPELQDVMNEKARATVGYDVFTYNFSPAGRLAQDDDEFYNLVYSNMIQLYATPTSSIYNFNQSVPELLIFDMPIFKGSDDAFRDFGKSDIGREIVSKVNENGVIGMCPAPAIMGWNVLSTKNDVKALADIKGMKTRVTNSAIPNACANAIGISPCNIAYSEMYTGVQQGTIDGTIVNINSVADQKLYEVCPYTWDYGLWATPTDIIYNMAWLDTVPEAVRDIAVEAFTEQATDVYHWAFTTAHEDYMSWIDNYEYDNGTVGGRYNFSDEVIAEINAALAPIPMEYADVCGGTEFVQSVIDWVNDYTA